MIRECKDCDVCCIEPSIIEANLEKPKLVHCPHLKRKGIKRCCIYKDRPPTCSNFRCLWLMGAGSVNDRPNKSKILLTLNQINEERVIIAREVEENAFFTTGKEILSAVLNKTQNLVIGVKYNPNMLVAEGDYIIIPSDSVKKYKKLLNEYIETYVPGFELYQYKTKGILSDYDFEEYDATTIDAVKYHWDTGNVYLQMNLKPNAKAAFEKTLEYIPDFTPSIELLKEMEPKNFLRDSTPIKR